MIRTIHQKYNNDCVVAAVAMVTREKYGFVLQAATDIGFVPDNDIGLLADTLLTELKMNSEWWDGFYVTDDPSQAWFVIVPSEYTDDANHIVVYQNGRIYDSSPYRKVSLKYAVMNAIHTGRVVD